MNKFQQLVAKRREHEILAAGLGVEISMALGDRDSAARYQKDMYALIAARDAQLQVMEEEGDCYFVLAGDVARMQAEARGAVDA